MLCTVQELRRLGYQVRIRHNRRYDFSPDNFIKPLSFFITKGEMKFDDEKIISREFEDLRDQLAELSEQVNVYLDKRASKEQRTNAIQFLFDLDNRDALTTVDILARENKDSDKFIVIGSGAAKVNETPEVVWKESKGLTGDLKLDGPFEKYDTFVKRVGLELALDKAIKDAHSKNKEFLNLATLQDRIDELDDDDSQEDISASMLSTEL